MPARFTMMHNIVYYDLNQFKQPSYSSLAVDVFAPGINVFISAANTNHTFYCRGSFLATIG